MSRRRLGERTAPSSDVRPGTFMNLPMYDELPSAEAGGKSAWGVFGRDDSLGTINLQSAEAVVGAARLVRKGSVFVLNAPLDEFVPPLAPGRGVLRHSVIDRGGGAFDDVVDNIYPQVSSQWDSLGHVGYRVGRFYNGATAADVLAGRRNTIEHWARRGIVGRGLVLDVARARTEVGRAFDPGLAEGLGVEDLELARRRAGLEFKHGDILLLRTGFLGWYRSLSTKARSSLPASLTSPGLDHDEALVRYLWDAGVSAVAADNFAVEVWPPDPTAGVFGFLHRVLIGQMGLALGELWDLDMLAADCAADGIAACLVVSAPLYLNGGIGSPANAVALK